MVVTIPRFMSSGVRVVPPLRQPEHGAQAELPIIGGPVSVLLVAAALMVAVVVWLLRRKRHPGPRLAADHDDIDREELDAAEREVRDLDLWQRPEDRFEGDDWGPGTTPRPRPPREP